MALNLLIRYQKMLCLVTWFIIQLIFESCSKCISLFQRQDGCLEETNAMSLGAVILIPFR